MQTTKRRYRLLSVEIACGISTMMVMMISASSSRAATRSRSVYSAFVSNVGVWNKGDLKDVSFSRRCCCCSDHHRKSLLNGHVAWSPFRELGIKNNMGLFSTKSSSSPPDDNNKKKKKKKKKAKKEKLRLNPNWEKEYDREKVSIIFDEVANEQGFTSETAHYADDATFEDDFVYDNLNESNDMEERLAAARVDPYAFSSSSSAPPPPSAAAAAPTREDMIELGYKHELNPYGDDESSRNPKFWSSQLISNSRTCSACGSTFQCTYSEKPGFIPKDKFQYQMKLEKLEDMMALKEKAENEDVEWSADDEIEFLIQSSGVPKGEETASESTSSSSSLTEDVKKLDIESMAQQLEIDLNTLPTQKKVICQRCHQLQNFGTVSTNKLRPGWTEEPLLSQQSFRDLLSPIRELDSAVIVALVDLFDFGGSVLSELDGIAGIHGSNRNSHPVILVANKVDLLPKKMGTNRAENWVRRELEYRNVKSLANVGGSVQLVSCKTGFGVGKMLEKVYQLAEETDADIYVVGAANAGKSTLINYLLDGERDNVYDAAAKAFAKDGSVANKRVKIRAGNANKKKGAVTVSVLPGTTLQFIKIALGNGKFLYDTPGLLVKGTYTQRLTPNELKMVVPKKPIEPITFRLSSDKCVLIGGLARIQLLPGSKPFLFTFYVSNDIKLHPTDIDKADEFINKHIGTDMLSPPLLPPPNDHNEEKTTTIDQQRQNRLEQLGQLTNHDVTIEGMGWKNAAADIAINGLGWIAVTGAGLADVRVSVPDGIGVSVRPPLMPFDMWEVTAKYTGGRAVRKSGRSKTGKRRSGVGRR